MKDMFVCFLVLLNGHFAPEPASPKDGAHVVLRTRFEAENSES